LRAIILTRNKKAIIKKVKTKNNDYEFRKAVYILDSKRVQNYTVSGSKISGAQLIFFEDNPNPINHEEKPVDLSDKYLDDVVVINFIQQTTDTFGKWGGDLGIFAWLGANISRFPYFIMFGLIAWTLVKNWLVGGNF